MVEEIKNNRLSKNKLIIIILVVTILATVIEATISIIVLKSDLKESTELFLNQIETVFQNNEEEEQLQYEGLKETYTIAAQAAAYILEDRPELQGDVSGLKKVASLLCVDELHIFDDTGTIVGGTNPEYYGLNFESGDQIKYFEPMLEDHTLSMCQDVTPNTAEGKSMMYAITWDSKGVFMVQVGVEPKRLLELSNEHNVDAVINSIPISEGYNIYAIDKETKEVVASSDTDSINDIVGESSTIHNLTFNKSATGRYIYCDGQWCYANYREINGYIVEVVYNVRYSNSSLFVPILILCIYLLLVGALITFILLRVHKREDRKNEAMMEQYNILASMADIYYTVYLIDLEKDTTEEFKSQGAVKQLMDKKTDAAEMMHQVMSSVTTDKYLEKALEFTDLSTLADRMEDQKIIVSEFVGKHIGWFLASFIVVERDQDERPIKVIYTTQSIDAKKKKEEQLIHTSTTDELTDCYNRRAYENTIQQLEKEPLDHKFVYVSVDVNGLKRTNDTLGHSAGDELIIGAAKCLKSAFKSYGKVFRTGGDEFVAFLSVETEQIEDVMKGLDTMIDQWSGDLIDQLSLSYGYVTRVECPQETIHQMAILADKKMYKAKSQHYISMGMDRRGQQDAHKALCALYTKILKVNLTDDSYQIVNMDEEEQTPEKGFADQISTWLSNFGTSGQVHPDDLEEYLKQTNLQYIKDYFSHDKTSLHIFYRRKCGDEYKKVMMEMIPASDYTDENQNIFLYVKDIDK